MLAGVAQEGDRLATLEALRDRLASEIDDCDSKRDLAALALRLTDVLEQIDELDARRPGGAADEIARRRRERRRRQGL